MTAERPVHPPLWKEDVAGLLNLANELEARTDVTFRRRGPQRVMEVADAVEHPRLATAVGDVFQCLEKAPALGRIVRERRNDELQAGLSIWIFRPLDLLCENLPPARNGAHRELLRERDVIVLGQLQTRDRFALPPDPLEPRQRRTRH